MESNFDKLMADLPQGIDDSTRELPHLNELMAALSHKGVPTSRVARLWSLGTTQLAVVVSLVGAWAKGVLSSQEKKEVLAHEAQIRAALKVLASMGYLRGAVAKVGQAIAAYPQFSSEEFSTVLSALNFEAPPMHYSLLREQLTNELGGDPDELFAEFDREAFAAASLGQVHRARLHNGDSVVVKVQYPNIAQTIRADIRNLKTIMAPMRFSKEWRFLIDTLDDIQDTFLEETDYRKEAEYSEQARKVLEDFDDIVVPRVHGELSSDRVLTMEALDGMHLEEYSRSVPADTEDGRADRDKRGAQLLRAMTRLFYSGRMVHADPNPGNYLFLSDGRLGIIDFGCCRCFDDEEWDYFCVGTQDFLAHGSPGDAILARGARLSDKELAEEKRVKILRDSVEWLWEPLLTEGPYTFDDAYLARGIDFMKEMTRNRYTRATPVNTWSNRMFYGIRVILCRLGARCNAKQIHDSAIERAGLA